LIEYTDEAGQTQQINMRQIAKLELERQHREAGWQCQYGNCRAQMVAGEKVCYRCQRPRGAWKASSKAWSSGWSSGWSEGQWSAAGGVSLSAPLSESTVPDTRTAAEDSEDDARLKNLIRSKTAAPVRDKLKRELKKLVTEAVGL
jgi:hypothetical protein